MLSRVTGIVKNLARVLRQPAPCLSRNILTITPRPIPTSLFSAPRPFRCFASNYPDHKVLDMPNLSPTMSKGTITKWYKKEGDSFNAGDVLCDVETDKATVGFEMVDAGILAKILVPAGTKDVPLGAAVAVVVDDAKDVAAFKDFKAPERAGKAAPKPAEAPKPAPQAAPQQAAAPKPAPAPQAAPKPAPAKCEAPSAKKFVDQDKVFASPAARKIAAEKGIDLSKVRPSGMGKFVTKADIIEYMEGGARRESTIPFESKPAIPGMPLFEDKPITNVKANMAQRYADTKKNVPHFYVAVECEVDKMLETMNFINKYSKSKITINDFLIKAAAAACTKVKDANAAFMNTFIRHYKDVDMSVAVQAKEGLFYPVVQKVNRKGLEAIATETKVFKEKGKKGNFTEQDTVGGTFSISNPGMHGIIQLIESVNAPQACMLGIGKVVKKIEIDQKKGTTAKPWKICHRMIATLSCDHRVVDGAVASEWTKEFKKFVEDPLLMLL